MFFLLKISDQTSIPRRYPYTLARVHDKNQENNGHVMLDLLPEKVRIPLNFTKVNLP